MTAWRIAQAACAAFVLAIAVYRKPQSFYTNFVALPALLLFLTGSLLAIVASGLASIGLLRGDRSRRGWRTIALALGSALLTFLVIYWRAH